MRALILNVIVRSKVGGKGKRRPPRKRGVPIIRTNCNAKEIGVREGSVAICESEMEVHDMNVGHLLTPS